MILEKFFTQKYDGQTMFVNPDVTFGEFKKFVLGQKKEFEKSDIENVVLLCESYFDFAVNFFAAVFARKNIYLLTDKTRLNQLGFEYIIPAEPAAGEGIFEGEYDPRGIMINLFTSGSTGTPKNIGKTLYNLEIEAQATIDEFALSDGIVIASTTSSAHSYGVAFNFILPFYGNYKINQKKIEFPEQFDINGDYILISTPSFMEKLAKYDFVFENAPEKIFLAGAKLKDETYSYFAKFSDVIDIYGSTETGNIAYKRGGENFTLINGVCVEPAVDGRITVTSDFFPADEMILNDIIEKISDREFVLKKRTDRLVKIQEKRISLDELENNLRRHDAVVDCHCFMYDEKLCCAVVCNEPHIEAVNLKKFLSDYSEILPKKWRILDEIPKTVSGKTDFAKLRKIFGSNLSLPFVFSRRVDASGAEIELLFKRNSNFLRGHFDGVPVLPGVVQLYYARFFAQDAFGLELPQDEVKKVKFSNVMKPDIKVTLVLVNKEKSVEFTYMADDKIFSSGIFVK